MIKCHLSRMMGERRLKISDVARETGLHRNTITLLYNESATRIDIETLDQLCRLFGCSVGDLLGTCWVAAPPTPKRKGLLLGIW